MIPALLDSSSALLSALLRASLEGAVLALLVAALCRLAPGLPARLRCWLWWLVGLKLLVGLAGIAPVRLAVLPAPERGAVSELRQAAEAAPRGLRVPPEAKPGEIGEVAP
ncbi:MAG TPA: hypothetical protein PK413_06540, partial [Thermoanaerobaculia bacterium]|nr:hypothetical protein [Thermoanaerobaculia bacterium]